MRPQAALKYDRFRLLDIDDMLILKMLGEGVKMAHAAKALRITPPAICHRFKKYARVWQGFSAKANHSVMLPRELNQTALDACAWACKALDALTEIQ